MRPQDLYPTWFWDKLKARYENYTCNINPYSDYAIVIVETRPIEDIDIIIKNHFEWFSRSVGKLCAVRIFCSPNTEPYYKNKIGDGIETSIVHNLDYNTFITSEYFWGCLLKYQKVLIFQWDSLLLREIPTKELFYYRYIGAPWPKSHIDLQGGNGGLSIRDPKRMKEICRDCDYSKREYGNEDLFFSRLLHSHEKPDNNIAQKIFVESLYSSHPAGIHAAYRYLSADQYNTILSQSLTVGI